MTDQQHTAQHSPVFGFSHLLILGIILVAGTLLSGMLLPLYGQHASAMALPPPDAIIVLVCWGVGAAAFFVIGWSVRDLHPRAALLGLLAGLGLCAVLVGAMALTLGNRGHLSWWEALRQIEGGFYWPHQLLAAALAAVALLLTLRPALARLSPIAIAPSGTPGRAFAFAAALAIAEPVTVRVGIPTAQPDGGHLRPPDDFMPITPTENVFGAVTIPGHVVLASVPEAAVVITPDQSVTIRLAFLVPQLNRAVAWLTWQQIFNREPEGGGEPTALSLRDRWVRIPAQYYVLQVPPEYYERKRTSSAWLSLPEVPQEANLRFEESCGE